MFMNKIAIIICWYGALPWYFKLFSQSVEFNPTIDVFFITDQNPPRYIPQNLKFFNLSLHNFNVLATSKLGFPVTVESPYKLCDFKPAYGVLFEEMLIGYDFWAHGDCDVIFGNIRLFLSKDLLDKYDVLSVRHDFLTGYLTIFRNNRLVNNLFTKSKDYKMVYQSRYHHCFDETNFHFDEFTNGKHHSLVASSIESMTHVVKKAQEKKEIRVHFDFLVIEGNGGEITWNNGKLLYKDKFEAILYHLIKFKTTCEYKELPTVLPSNYRIGRTNLFF